MPDSTTFPLPKAAPQSLVNGLLIQESESAFLARYPRTNASILITISGAVANGDQLRVTINLPALPGGKISKTVALVTGDSLTTAAQKLAAAINGDTSLRDYGVYANSLLGVVTMYWPGALGNYVTLNQTVIAGSEVITFGNSGAMSGGSGPIFITSPFSLYVRGQLISYRPGKMELVGDNVLAAMAAAGSPIR